MNTLIASEFQLMESAQPTFAEEAVTTARSALEAALADSSQHVAASPAEQNDWALPTDEQRFLASLVAHLKPRHILELGSGTSTQVLTRASEGLGNACSITSVDHDPDFRQSTISGLGLEQTRSRIALQFAPVVLRECGGKLLPVYRLRPHRFASRCPADLILIDGPPQALGGREGTLYQLLDFTRAGTVILLDDANRAEERAALSRWRDNLGAAIEIRLLPEFSHGMAAILVREHIATSELWNHRLQLCKQELQSLIPPDTDFILVDEDNTREMLAANGNAIPFLEQGGEYFGPPADDATAIRELERLRFRASFIVFVWPAFWWLEHYAGFREYLRLSYRCLLENDRMLIFDLRV